MEENTRREVYDVKIMIAGHCFHIEREDAAPATAAE